MCMCVCVCVSVRPSVCDLFLCSFFFDSIFLIVLCGMFFSLVGSMTDTTGYSVSWTLNTEHNQWTCKMDIYGYGWGMYAAMIIIITRKSCSKCDIWNAGLDINYNVFLRRSNKNYRCICFLLSFLFRLNSCRLFFVSCSVVRVLAIGMNQKPKESSGTLSCTIISDCVVTK